MSRFDSDGIFYLDGSAEASSSRSSSQVSTTGSVGSSRRPSSSSDIYDSIYDSLHTTQPPTPANIEEPLEQPPLIVVEGFCCATNSLVWGDYRTWLDRGENHWRAERAAAVTAAADLADAEQTAWRRRPRLPRRVIFAPIGPVSSIHDRACELFYALKGGTIDYGAEHAREHGHSRFGRTYERGLWEGWSADKPVHLIGHSLGGPTILKLQSLLREGFFDHALRGAVSAPSTDSKRYGKIRSPHADKLIRSITSVSSPHRGTPLVHLLGLEPSSPSPSVRFLAAGDLLAKVVHLAVYLDIGPDLLSDAWPFSPRRSRASSASPTHGATREVEDKTDLEAQHEDARWEGMKGLLKQLKKSSWAEGRDCAPWDCSITAREEEEQRESWGEIRSSKSSSLHTTWYRSYAAYMTMPIPAGSGDSPGAPHHMPKPSAIRVSPLTFAAKLLGKYDYAQIVPQPSFLRRPETGTRIKSATSLSKGKARELDDLPWRLVRKLSQQAATPKTTTQLEPLLGGATPSLASLGSSAQLSPAAADGHAGHDYFGDVTLVRTPETLEQWYASDGVVPLASQYHPGPCEEGKCLHYAGLPGATPQELAAFEKRQRKQAASRIAPMMQRTGSGGPRPRPWEADTPADEDEENGESDSGRATPTATGWSLTAALKRRAFNVIAKAGVPFVNERDDPHFRAWSSSPPHHADEEAQPSSSPEMGWSLPRPREIAPELLLPEPNRWHTYVLRDTSHTALCPLWIGTEQQRVFWSGMGSWLASVDEAAHVSQ